MSYLDTLRNIKLFGKPEKEKEKEYSGLNKKSVKKIAQEVAAKENGTDAAMDKWFEDGRETMTGVCLFCGGKTEKHNDKTYRNSEAHLFAKRKNMFPFIALHPENRIELCFFGNSCHTNFDNHMIELEDIKYNWPKAWEVIGEKTKILYHCMTEKEKNKVPDILLQAIGVHQ